MGWLSTLGFVLASFKTGTEKDIYLMVGLGSMILFILSLYELRANYRQYYNYTEVSQNIPSREPKVRFQDETEEDNEIMHV